MAKHVQKQVPKRIKIPQREPARPVPYIRADVVRPDMSWAEPSRPPALPAPQPARPAEWTVPEPQRNEFYRGLYGSLPDTTAKPEVSGTPWKGLALGASAAALVSLLLFGVSLGYHLARPSTPGPVPPPLMAKIETLEARIATLQQTLTELVEKQVAVEDAASTDVQAAKIEPDINAAFATTEIPMTTPAEAATTTAAVTDTPAPPPKPSAAAVKADKVTLTLSPGEGVQIKLVMAEGAVTNYAWSVLDGLVNYDMQGEATGGGTKVYKSRRDASSDNGKLTAAFTGSHGWFWRNSGSREVVVTLATRGEYSAIKGVP